MRYNYKYNQPELFFNKILYSIQDVYFTQHPLVFLFLLNIAFLLWEKGSDKCLDDIISVEHFFHVFTFILWHQVLDDCIFAFFAVEMVIKMVALGIFGSNCYLGDKWNQLDFVIVMAGWVFILLFFSMPVEFLFFSLTGTKSKAYGGESYDSS